MAPGPTGGTSATRTPAAAGAGDGRADEVSGEADGKVSRGRSEHARRPGHPTLGGHKLEAVTTAHGLELTVHVDGPVGAYKSSWLDDPRRLVIDVRGAHSAMDALEYALPGPLASRLRVGVHSDRVRFVAETTGSVTGTVSAEPEGTTLVVRLRAP
jgi:hypothetical protein